MRKLYISLVLSFLLLLSISGVVMGSNQQEDPENLGKQEVEESVEFHEAPLYFKDENDEVILEINTKDMKDRPKWVANKLMDEGLEMEELPIGLQAEVTGKTSERNSKRKKRKQQRTKSIIIEIPDFGDLIFKKLLAHLWLLFQTSKPMMYACFR
ncbi:hypothetical protein [Alteribacillus bidgolensis]|uniref:Uncharacterized protein n=1 Tax=Alteribacillus bidgolensis TaxID=930129 RepID=A0A1G8MGN2_9BACI|nr:hypothetical protein [Alteribacillus bidgolensis]SDI67178.1 hypothetical protein SAMN05216352_11038 [Alteribacillus bidgolensis]